MARVLLINPPIYDFAAYDLWARPLGLLYIAAHLESLGHEVRILDCLDRLHPAVCDTTGKRAPRSRHYGTGSYYWQEVEKPAVYSHVPRVYKRFGLPQDVIRSELARGARPDFIGVTSAMTYWYPGVLEAVRTAREVWPGVPLALGGIYATLCSEHARRVVQPDFLVTGAGEDAFARLVETGDAGDVVDNGMSAMPGDAGASPDDVRSRPSNAPATVVGDGKDHRACDGFSDFSTPFDALGDPAYHLLPRLESASILTGHGCPFRCAYCASQILSPKLERRSPQRVADEIARYAQRGIADIAFYDDALLWDSERHLKPLLRLVLRQGTKVRFHTPNGLHVRFLDEELARLMREAGFVTMRLSLETISRERQAAWDNKAHYEEFLAAVHNLRSAGFSAENLGAYVMAGVPGELPQDAVRAILAAHAAGVAVRLAEYSPIPGTADFSRAQLATALDLTEPLLQNNTIVPIGGPKAAARHQLLKDLARMLNSELAAGRVVVTQDDVEGDVRAIVVRLGISESVLE